MKFRSALLSFTLTLLIALSSTAILYAEETVRLPGGTVRFGSFPATVQLEKNTLLVIRLAGSSAAERMILENAGINLHMQIAPNTWWATSEHGGSMPSSAAILGLYQPAPEDKIQPMLQRRLAHTREEKNIAVRVSFLPGLSTNEIELTIRAAGGTTVGQLLIGNSIEVLVPSDQISALAASDRIVALEAGGRQRRSLNKRAAKLSGADVARADFGLSGAGIVAGVWDGGPVFIHKEFKNRLIVVDGGRSDSHATHVAGTIGATGLKARARGLAPEVEIVSYDFNGDVAGEIANALNRYGVALANNSWGLANGWEWEDEWVWYGDEFFGSYSADARGFDEMIANTGVIVLFAAGNDRGDKGAGNGRHYDWVDGRYKTNSFHPADGPYDTIGEIASAKNVIAVGAVRDRGPMTSFSSWGPVDDGRIKPEIVANGASLYSTVLRNRYGRSSGTSMAAPAVTGGLALVAEMWQQIYNERLRVDMAKALLAATATDAGRPGPDYSFGFGIMDVPAMVERIDAGTIENSSVSPNRRKQNFNLAVPGGTKNLRVAIAWIDPAAAPQAEITLVNDLDLTLTAPDGTVFRPWILNPAVPTANATRGINSVDNIELVQINTPKAGAWKVTIEGVSLGSGKAQAFALVAHAATNVQLN